MAKVNDPLFPDMGAARHRNPKLARPSTLPDKGGPRTTADKGASAAEHLSPMPKEKRKHDPYRKPDVSHIANPAHAKATAELARLMARDEAAKRKGKS